MCFQKNAAVKRIIKIRDKQLTALKTYILTSILATCIDIFDNKPVAGDLKQSGIRKHFS